MRIYMAPLEGVTGFVFRNAYAKYYGGVDKYFTPFITPHTKKNMDERERRDILPENNKGINLVPQVLTNKSEELISISKELADFGYQEINLNIGCPSRTVTAKGKGSAFLEQPEELEQFFDDYFSKSDVPLSIKTRMGMWDMEEFPRLAEIFEKFPFSEVIIHARLGSEFYSGMPHREEFQKYGTTSKQSLCYNGDILTRQQLEELNSDWSLCNNYMIGRGLVKNPAMLQEGKNSPCQDLKTFRRFHDAILIGYQGYLSGDRPTIMHMKELWSYWAGNFPGQEKRLKQIKKSNHMNEYRIAVEQLLQE